MTPETPSVNWEPSKATQQHEARPMKSVTVHVEKNTISGNWEVRENAVKVVETKYQVVAIQDAETIRKDLESKGVEVIAHFDLRG